VNGGKTILLGLAVLLVFCWLLTMQDAFWPLVDLIKGSVALLLLAVGAVFLVIGLTDLKSQKAEAAADAGSKS